jgi:hypothetical protein
LVVVDCELQKQTLEYLDNSRLTLSKPPLASGPGKDAARFSWSWLNGFRFTPTILAFKLSSDAFALNYWRKEMIQCWPMTWTYYPCGRRAGGWKP